MNARILIVDDELEIREMLSTAADNQDRDNIVMSELFKEVITKVKKMSSGSLI